MNWRRILIVIGIVLMVLRVLTIITFQSISFMDMTLLCFFGMYLFDSISDRDVHWRLSEYWMDAMYIFVTGCLATVSAWVGLWHPVVSAIGIMCIIIARIPTFRPEIVKREYD